ncbi:major facilitator superfamily MFS_1 [Kribbella flavida DSM 17836]|uniref:Major facilitator superfamily MFS_1 n=1 Tax=Kribbella flavida (strain DSM 17836 / JCM 10339 / NBRC 14399) TaxID=479435 RepID=D2Q0H9_KRIFD|nr:MFS transporter [Kribbella flavida]ADB31971.1 major facilitator superfamily MFS_1 [Kribbella flavida DSM 17836]
MRVSTQPVLALSAAASSFFLITLNSSLVTTALPSVGRELGTGPALAWVLTGYSLVFAVCLLPAGAWSDRIGARRTFGLGMVAFVITSAVCALADTLALLLAARAVQGAAAAAILPSGLAMLTAAAPDQVRRTRAIAHWTAAGAVALVVGSPVGGAITTAFGWPATFWLNVVLGIAVLVTALALRPADHPVRRPAGAGTKLRSRAVVVSAVTGFTVNFASYGAIFVVTLFVQQLLDRSAWTSGLVFVPMTLLIIPANLLAARLTTRHGATRVLVLGQTLMLVGLLGLCSVDDRIALWVVIGWLLPIGAGAGLVAPAMTAMMLDGVPSSRAGFGAGLLNASRQTGSGAAAALFGLLLGGSQFLTGLRTSLVLAAAVVAVSTLTAVGRRKVHLTGVPTRSPDRES